MDLRLFKTFKDVLPTVVCIEGGQVLHPLFEGTINLEMERDNVTQSLHKYNQIFTKMDIDYCFPIKTVSLLKRSIFICLMFQIIYANCI